MLKINNDEIKIIISDYDGTLRAGKNSQISDETVKTLRKAVNDGVYFVINTGNLPFEMKETVQMISPISETNKYIICSNGNAIHNYLNDHCEVLTYFDNKTTNAIVNKVKNMDLIYDVTSYDLKNIYYSNKEYMQFMIDLGWSKDAHLNRVPVTDEIMKNIEKCPKITLKNVKPEDKVKVVEMIEKDFPDLNIYSTWFSPDGVDFSIAGPDKYQGIIALLEIINKEHNTNIGLNNVVYFGDQHNDYEVFKKLKYSIAVDNAIDEIKELAYDVTLSADEFGVAAYINKITQ